ncbi:MAG: T9SS type A sorting domain-containing protein [Saprospiraceae bacterium]|nr:T9SS type A sorting domain-containing protein [Candidatus Vicinibacter affinis]
MDGIGSKVNSSPTVYDFGGKYKLFAGGFLGKTLVCGDIESNIYNDFKIEYTDYGSLREGEKTHLSLADIDQDGILEMAVGNQRGGFSIFKTTFQTNGNQVSTADVSAENFIISPNPANDFITCDLSEPNDGNISIYNMQGQLKFHHTFENQNFIHLNISLTPGLYVVKLATDTYRKFQTLIVK